MTEGIGDERPGDELWKCSLPVIVFISRAGGYASLDFTMANGAHLSAPISIHTADGLINDLQMKRLKRS
jgi:hypothetical protein